MKLPVIPYSYAKNPHGLWYKWTQLSSLSQWLWLILATLFAAYMPCADYYQALKTLHQTEREIADKTTHLQHQSRLLQSLQQKTSAAVLTAQTAARLSPINQHIQQLLAENQLQLLHNQWHFFVSPTLSLQLEGQFLKFQSFLTALLQDYPELNLTKLHIEKVEKADEQENPQPISLLFSFSLRLPEKGENNE